MSKPGLFGKYLIAKADGTPLDSDARYVAVRYDGGAEHGHIGRMALRIYAHALLNSAPQFAEELLAAIDAEADNSLKAMAQTINPTEGVTHDNEPV